jgi:hypothetical protein
MLDLIIIFAWALKVPAFVFAAALFFGAVEVFGK